ncbi:MAG: hypothetical protein IJ564_02890 [Alphaproteobacteria bacterium]|nr:hypothetical protein [Alphaproteobacteria bacterium]
MRKIVIDIETTGKNFEKDKIISLSAIEIDEYCRLTGNVFCSLINPQCRIPRQISTITGITQATVKDKPTFSKLENNFLCFLENKELVVFDEAQSLNFIYMALGFALPNETTIISELANKNPNVKAPSFFDLLNRFDIKGIDTMWHLRPLSRCHMMAKMYKELTIKEK